VGNRSEWKHLGIMRKAQENRRKWLSPEAASRCHNDPALRTPVLPPLAGRENVQPIAVITQSLGINCIVANVWKRRPRRSSFYFAICTLTRTKCASRVTSFTFEDSVQTWPKIIERTTSMPLDHTTQSRDAEGVLSHSSSSEWTETASPL
jgi:hypothetical protein